MAFPKVDGLTSKLKRRLLWGNFFAYLTSMLFNFWGFGATEDHWTHRSKVGKKVAAANAGFFMLWWYGVWPGGRHDPELGLAIPNAFLTISAKFGRCHQRRNSQVEFDSD